MQKGNMRLLAVLAAVAVAVAGLLIVLSQLGGGGGSRDMFAGIPQDGTTLGRADAPVEIRLYVDFQCPVCAQFERETLPEIVEGEVRPGGVKLVSQTLAFLGPDSVRTARAALAAGAQDRYWEYGHLLFENQGAENSGYATEEFLTNLAEETEGLDVAAWREARDDAFVEEELRLVQEQAGSDGVDATPTLVITAPGGERTLEGAVPLEEIEEAIDEVEGS